MNRKELEVFAREVAKSIKTEKNLNSFSQMLTKITVEAALNAELDEYLGYDNNQLSEDGNTRNDNRTLTLIPLPVILTTNKSIGYSVLW